MMIDLTNISQWTELWQLKLNNKKCSVLHIGSRNPNYVYLLNNVPITNMHKMKDLDITVNDCLCFDSYIDTIVAKAYRICYGILKGFYTRSPKFLMAMFKIYVRPLLEYNAIIWSPTSLYIDKCERIQRYFTKRLKGFLACTILVSSGTVK